MRAFLNHPVGEIDSHDVVPERFPALIAYIKPKAVQSMQE